MSLYPPLTQEQLTQLNAAIADIVVLKTLASQAIIPSMYAPGDEDMLTRAVAELRGRIAKLDLALFRIFGLVHDLKASNVPAAPFTSTPVQRKAPPTLDDLSEMFT